MPQKHKQFDSDDDGDQDYTETVDHKVVGHTPVDVADDSDSDEAPEDISSGQSKMESVQQMRNIVNQMKDAKEKQRQKNKQHAQLFAAQKAARLEQLEAYRLPADVKDAIADDFGKKIKTRPPVNQHAPARPSVEDDDEETEMSLFDDVEADFIPLDPTAYRTRSVNVVRVKDNSSNTSAQSAAEFRQAALGGARVKRVPVKSRMALTVKRRARFC